MILIESAVGVRASKERLFRAVAAVCVPAFRALLTAVGGRHGNDEFSVSQRLVLGISQSATPHALVLDRFMKARRRGSSVGQRFARLVVLRLWSGHHVLDFQIFKGDHIRIGIGNESMRSLVRKVFPNIAPVRMSIVDFAARFATSLAVPFLPRKFLLEPLDALVLGAHTLLFNALETKALRLRLQGRHNASVATDRTRQKFFGRLHSQAGTNLVLRLGKTVFIRYFRRTEGNKEPAPGLTHR